MFEAFYLVRVDVADDGDREWLPGKQAAANRVKAGADESLRLQGSEAFAIDG